MRNFLFFTLLFSFSVQAENYLRLATDIQGGYSADAFTFDNESITMRKSGTEIELIGALIAI